MIKILEIYWIGAAISGCYALTIVFREKKKRKISKSDEIKVVILAFFYSWLGVYLLWKNMRK